MRLNNIQMLRGVASILVVMHHILPHYIVMGGGVYIITFISTWGFLGVDIFFVISGFIMAFTTFNKPRDIKSAKIFIWHRLARVYLAYWMFLAMGLAVIIIAIPSKIDSLNLLGSFLLTELDMKSLVLPISWSLSYELYFYLLFTISFFLSIRLLKVFSVAIFLIILVLVLFINNPSFFYSNFLLEFFSGVILYSYIDRVKKLWLLPILIIIASTAYWFGVEYELRNGLYRILSFGVGALTVVWIFLILEQEKIYQAGKFLVKLGDASYTIYLSHLIIIWSLYFIGFRDIFSLKGELISFIGWILMLLIITIFSLIFYKKVEKPIYKMAISKVKI